MNSPTDAISYTPVPCMCSGIITSKLEDTESYEVSIYESPLGELNGPVYCTLIFTPGQDNNYKQGDYVKVMTTFMFGGADNNFIDVATGFNNYILGTFNERSFANIKIKNPISESDKDGVKFINEKNGAGIIATDSGQLLLATGGAINSFLKPFGFGINENLNQEIAQNFHRIISHNSPFYFAREYFGMYAGSDINDKASRVMPEDYLINFRRFVLQTKSPDNWVSTCEGTFAPWVGANIDEETVEKGKEVLFSKIMNFGDSRATIEIGEPGDSFINIRVDDVKVNEKNIPTSPGATPAILGNRFKLNISDKGEMDLRAASKGVPTSNLNAFHLSIDDKGNVIFHAKGKMIFSHGDFDESNNSIVLDPKKGIDITGKNGVRINGQEAVLKAFVDFLQENQAQWCLSAAPGSPAPINPAVLPLLIAGILKFGEIGGFTSTGKGPPATGTIQDEDIFESV